MKVSNKNANKNKSKNKRLLNGNNQVNKSTSLNKSKNVNKSINSNKHSKGKVPNKKSKKKLIKNNNIQNEHNENNNNYNNNYNEYFNNDPHYLNNNYISNSLNLENSLNSEFNNNLSIVKKNKNNSMNLNNKPLYINELKQTSSIFKKTLDRLISTSNGLMEKQNNILNECDTLSKNMAVNDFSIQKITKNEKNNFPNVLENYTTDISSLISKVKKNVKSSQINDELKKENILLKNKLEVLNINQEDNIKIKDNEISTLKIVLISEINHILNFLAEIGYNNIPFNKMEASDVTSQKLTNFFEILIKIIKQMKENIIKKDSIISKMTIEQNTLRDNKSENFNNKSFEKLSLDYNSYNLGLKNYNMSVQNSNQRRKYNISFRNNINNKNLKNEFNEAQNEYYNAFVINNDKYNNINSQKDLMINEEKNELKYKMNDNNNNNELEEEINKDKKLESASYFFNKDQLENNYSYDKESKKSYQTGNFVLNANINNNSKKDLNENEKLDSNINDDIIK